MNVPTLVDLRDQLGRELIAHPNAKHLHKANALLRAVFARQGEIPGATKLGAARATALALDLSRANTLTAGNTVALLSDSLDPQRVPGLSTMRARVGDIDALARLQELLTRAQQSLRDAPGQAALDVANALDAAYQAVAESARDVGKGAQNVVEQAARSATLPAAIVIGVLVAWGFSRRRA